MVFPLFFYLDALPDSLASAIPVIKGISFEFLAD
jgi:hypothetical protein